MPTANTKIVQAFIQAVIEVTNKVIEADNLAQTYKAKWIALNPNLTGTNLTPAQVSVVNTWITSLNNLKNDPVVTVAQNKNQPSHGISALG